MGLFSIFKGPQDGGGGGDEPRASGKILQPSDITRDRLRAMFERAGLFLELDKDGDIRVRDTFSAYVMPKAEGKQIRFFSLFNGKASASRAAKERLANKINTTRHQPRACVTADGNFVFDQTMVTEGGVTEDQIVRACRWHLSSLLTLAILDKEDALA